jgi:hypothetical protein
VRKRKKGGIKSDLPKRAHEKDLRNKKKKLKEGIIIEERIKEKIIILVKEIIHIKQIIDRHGADIIRGKAVGRIKDIFIAQRLNIGKRWHKRPP